MLILVFLGMYFDAAVVFVKISSILFRLALAILCLMANQTDSSYLKCFCIVCSPVVRDLINVYLNKLKLYKCRAALFYW